MSRSAFNDPVRSLARLEIAVAVAADEELARRRIVAALEDDGLTVTRAVAALEELTEQRPSPDVVVVACRDSTTRRTEILRTLRRHLSDAQVVLVCPAGSEPGMRRALEVGAGGFVLDVDLDIALGPTVRSVRAGQVVVPWRGRHQLGRPELSYRQMQILGLVALGYHNAEIGQLMYLAESTVKSHLSAAFTKLGVRSRSQAAARVMDPDEGLGACILAAGEWASSSIPYQLWAASREPASS